MLKISSIITATLATAAVLAPTSANAYGLDRRVRINNYSDQAIYEVHITNLANHDWGRDLLGSSETIGADRSMVWDVDDGSGYCRFDFKIVMADGSVRTKRDYNVCAETHLDVVD